MALSKSARANKFAHYWLHKDHLKYKEKGNVGAFWRDLLHNVYQVNDPHYIEREKSVPNMDNHTDFIDVYIPTTKVLIEQKAPKYRLDKPELRKSLGGMVTPYQQAWKYNSDLPYSQRARWIVTCNFKEFWIYDMNQSGTHPVPTKVQLKDLWRYYYQLDFLTDPTRQDVKREYNVSSKACDIIDEIYHKLLDQYDNPKDPVILKNVNKLCVRLVFCLYADDSGIFGKRNMFHDYMKPIPPYLWHGALIQLFKVLNEKRNERDSQLNDKLLEFPYVNGGMFADKATDKVIMPKFNNEIKTLIINKASEHFDWSRISPTIFGSLFETTLNPKERRTNGMHYTSVKNIHKIIDPLFLNDLRHDLNTLKTKYKTHDAIRRHAIMFQNKLASLKFFDPACGSGNFLTETYLCLRRLENQAIELMLTKNGQIQTMWALGKHVIKVSIHQFYGIEINDFAVSVAKTAMWIAESQMVQQTQNIINQPITFLPLKSNPNIIEYNALEMDWDDMNKTHDLAKHINYIISNPPFVGTKLTNEQKKDRKSVMKGFKNIGRLDYVACWYRKSAHMMAENPNINTALVSTNSIVQGVQVGTLWKPLIDKGFHINFAYHTFKWNNATKTPAQVFCIIIGFSLHANKHRVLFDKSGRVREVKNISPYLKDLPDIIVTRATRPLCHQPKMCYGNKPTDGGHLTNFSDKDVKDIVKKYPNARKYFRKIVRARGFMRNEYKWCLWLYHTDSDWEDVPKIQQAVDEVDAFRKDSKAKTTRDYPYPYLFRQIAPTGDNYLLVPIHSSGKREYIPFGFETKNVIANNSCSIIPHANKYLFGILISRIHMIWTSLTAGRIKGDFRYSSKVTYNTFPWPKVTDKQKAKISDTAQGILNARKNHADTPLIKLYKPKDMPPDLFKAHRDNDRAVAKAYGFKRTDSKRDIELKLLKQYAKLSANADK